MADKPPRIQGGEGQEEEEEEKGEETFKELDKRGTGGRSKERNKDGREGEWMRGRDRYKEGQTKTDIGSPWHIHKRIEE